MLFVLLGEQPLQARENLLWGSRNLYLAFQQSLIGLRQNARETIVKARDSLPPDVAEQYIQGLTMLIGDGYGNDPVQRLLDQLDDLADNQIDLSQKVQASKWEIIAEIIMLIAELAILTALMAFTGGASVSEMFLARARSRFAILMIVDRLLRMTHLMPTLTEAVEEAIQTLAVRLAQIGLNDGGRKPDGIDWADVGKAAAFGALTGAFMGVFEQFFKPLKNIFKNYMDDVLTKFKFDPDTLIFKGLKNGPGEIAGAFVIGVRARGSPNTSSRARSRATGNSSGRRSSAAAPARSSTSARGSRPAGRGCTRTTSGSPTRTSPPTRSMTCPRTAR